MLCLTVWGVEPVVTHQPSWLERPATATATYSYLQLLPATATNESTGVCGVQQSCSDL